MNTSLFRSPNNSAKCRLPVWFSERALSAACFPGDLLKTTHKIQVISRQVITGGARPNVLQNFAGPFRTPWLRSSDEAVLIEKNKFFGLRLSFQCQKFYVLQAEKLHRINNTVWNPPSIFLVRAVANPDKSLENTETLVWTTEAWCPAKYWVNILLQFSEEWK